LSPRPVGHRDDEPGNVIPFFDGVTPVVVLVGIELARLSGSTWEDCLPNRGGVRSCAARRRSDWLAMALHADVQRGVDAQPTLVHRLRAVRGFQILADILEEVRRQVVARILNVQAERRFPVLASSAADLASSSSMRMDPPDCGGEREIRIRER